MKRDGVGLDGDYGDEENNDYGDGVGVGVDGDNGDGVDTDKSHVKVDKLLRGVPFQKDGNEIKFSVGQTFANKEVCNNKEAKIKWIASKFDSTVKSNPSINVKVLCDLLLDKFNVSVNLKRLYGVKHRVLMKIRSDHARSFKYPWQYAYTLNQTNPGAAIHMRVQKPLSTFHILFLSFKAHKLGFLEGCRPFIGLDGCHLKGHYGGILLSAMALDANSGMFPLAVCICEKKTKQKGLIKALSKHFPNTSKRFCVRHIYANFRGSYCGDSFKKLFWKASRSINVYVFKAALNDIVIRCDHVPNNMIKAFNSLFGTHRSQTYLRDQEYEIMGQDGTFAMKLRQYNCRCGSWQISGIPCPHAMAVISHNYGKEALRDMVPRYVHQCLTKSAYMQIYMGMIHPVPNQKMWPEIKADEVLPPPFQVQPGRPMMQRKRESGEKGK
ncbi:hypothetical protein EZV62_024558 [Acer yangbiense]|uniref:SWIM-type domain-containing protein n=1 Tax=Acer yangbiense TaxID=1000413 RepID=A0A5C7GVF2_9ROSI|nr:hypothetical protein EZV62_024558 [Acer yangbiense]